MNTQDVTNEVMPEMDTMRLLQETQESLFGQVKKDQELREEAKVDVSKPSKDKEIDSSYKPEDPSESPATQKDEGNNLDTPQTPRDKQEKKTSEDYEKLNQRFLHSQRFATKNTTALKAVRAKIEQLSEEGSLSEEERDSLIKSMSIEGIVFNEETVAEPIQTTLSPICNILTGDLIQQYIDFSGDILYQGKIHAFDALYTELSPEEQEQMVDLILEEKIPMRILKKVLALGEENLKSEYGEVIAAGSPKKYAIAQKQEIKKRDDKIAKLEAKISQYEDFVTPSSSSRSAPSASKGDSLSNYQRMMEDKANELLKMTSVGNR
jgi:hypothetical protein